MKTQPLIPYYLQYRDLQGITSESRRISESYLNRFAQALPDLPVSAVPIFKYLGTVGNSFGSRLKARKVLSAFYTWVCSSYDGLENPMPGVKVPKRRAKNGTPQPTPPHPPTHPQSSNTAHIAGGDTLEDRVAQRVLQGLSQGAVPYLVGNTPELTTQQAIAAYLDECRKGAKPKSESTIAWELTVLKRLQEQHPALPMDGAILGRFIGTARSKKQRHMYSRVLVTFYGTLSRLYSWKRQGVFNPTDKDEMQRVSYEAPQDPPLQADELERLLGAIQGAETDVRLCHLLLLTTGLRPIEIVNLESADFLGTRVQVKGKTKPRLVELIPELAKALKALTPKGGRIFERLQNRDKGRGADSVRYWTDAMMKDANVRGGRGGGRLFRHTFACWLYSETGDLKLVKDVLGHTTLDMSLHYAKQRMSKTAEAATWYDLVRVTAICHKQEKVALPETLALLINGMQSTGQEVSKPTQPRKLSEAYRRQYQMDGKRDSKPKARPRFETGGQAPLL